MRRNEGKVISTNRSTFYKIKLDLRSDKNYGQDAILQAQVTNLFNSKLICERLQGYFTCRLTARRETETTDRLCSDKRKP